MEYEILYDIYELIVSPFNKFDLISWLIMMKYFIFLLILLGCSHLNETKDGEVAINLTCLKNEIGCSKFKDTDGKEVWLRDNPRIYLKISKSYLVQDNESKRIIQNITLAPDGFKILEVFTNEYLGKEAALVYKGEVIYYSQIHSPIVNGVILFPLGEKISESEAIKFCKELDSECPDKVSPVRFNQIEVPSLFGYVDLFNIEENYSNVQESLLWYSPLESVLVYPDKEFKGIGRLRSNPPIKKMAGTNRLYFVGAQEYENGKFIHGDGAIKIENLGWIGRKQLVPGNVLRSPFTLKNEINSFKSLKKCGALFKNMEVKQDKNLPMVLNNIMGVFDKDGQRFVRDSKEGLCSHLGPKLCSRELKKIDEWVKNVDCKELQMVFRLDQVMDSDIQSLESHCFNNNKIFSCFVLKEYFLYQKKEIPLKKVYKKGCELKNAEMCYYHAKYNNNKMALQKSCSLGFLSACHNIGFQEFKKGKKKKAISIYKKNCDGHNYQSCSNLGGIFLSQKKLKQSYSYLKRSCRFNNPTGCYNLACYYSLSQDIQSSLKKLEKSFQLGLPVDDWVEKKDPDLAFIRGTLEFKVLIKTYKKD